MLNQGKVSIIVPAFNEADRLGDTLDAIIHHRMADEIVVVDDGSTDTTVQVAIERGVRVVKQQRNRGKGAAMNAGLSAARGEVIVFLDADLGDTAARAKPIIDAVKSGDADIAIAAFSSKGGGFGFVLRFARMGVRLTTGFKARAPLSGQRALNRRTLDAIYPLRHDFGVETAMLIDAINNGFKVVEIPVDMSHRPTGRTIRGFLHRAKQGKGIALAILSGIIKYKILGFARKKKTTKNYADTPFDDFHSE